MTTKLKGKLDFGNTTINYSVIKTKRRKTSEIIVDKDTVEIRAPFDKPDEEIRNIVKDKANWILKKQDEYRKMNSEITKPTFGENSTLPYLGKNYPLRIFNRKARNSISFADGQFIVNIWPSKNVTAQYVEKLYEHWLMKIAHPIFKNKIESYSEKLDVAKPEKIVIKRLKKRWGSIGKKGDTIILNVNLVKAPEDIMNYIVLHELCHLKIKEHSHRFWELLHRYMANYQEKKDWLDINGIAII